MLLDKRNEFADAVSVVAAASTINLGNVIDSGTVVRDLGTGEPLYLVISVDTSIITGGVAGTIQFLLVSDSSATPAVDGSASVHYASKAFVTDDDALNDLDAGETAVCIPLPAGGQVPYERYIGVQAVIATTAVTAGAVSAFLTPTPAMYKAYPDATN